MHLDHILDYGSVQSVDARAPSTSWASCTQVILTADGADAPAMLMELTGITTNDIFEYADAAAALTPYSTL